MATSAAASCTFHLLADSRITAAAAAAGITSATSDLLHNSNRPNTRADSPLTRVFLPHLSPPSPLSLHIRSRKPYPIKIKPFSTSNSPIPLPDTTSFITNNLLTDSTRTIFASVLLYSKILVKAIESISRKLTSITPTPTPTDLTQIRELKDSLVYSISPLFFAAVSDGVRLSRAIRARPLNTPVSVVAGAMVKCLEIYEVILTVRILLQWLPNVPWKKQPFLTIRDLSEPYYNLFKDKIPPLFIPPIYAVDIGPLYASLALRTVIFILAHGLR